MCVARIEEMILTEEGFEARARVHIPIPKESYRPFDWSRLEKGWTFGGKWEYLCLSGNSFSMAYLSAVFWTAPDFVQKIEALALEQNYKEAVRIIFGSI